MLSTMLTRAPMGKAANTVHSQETTQVWTRVERRTKRTKKRADDARRTPFTAAFLDHLDERICVPRDLGAPPAAAIRALRRRLCDVPAEAPAPPARRAAAPRRTMF